MKKSKFTEAQYVLVIKQFETGTRVDEISRQMGISKPLSLIGRKSMDRWVCQNSVNSGNLKRKISN